jgi:hypothetical protein
VPRAGTRADGKRKEDEGSCDANPYCMQSCASDNIQDATQWRSLVLTASRGNDDGPAAGGAGDEEKHGKGTNVGRNSAW